MGGSKECKARAITDFAVPRRPAIATPPNPGSTAANSRANLIASCPTTAVRGKAVVEGLRLAAGIGFSDVKI